MYKRIISLAPSNTEILYALNAQDSLVAATRYCDFPKDARAKPKIGGWLDINHDLVKSFDADLLLTSTFVQNKITDKYKKMEMNIIHLMPTTIKGVLDSILKIGKIVDRQKEAVKLAVSMKNEFVEIQNKTRKSKNKPRIYVEEWHNPPTVSGNWVPTLARMAGGDYGLIKAGTHSREVSAKQIIGYDPEIIIISICGLSDRAPKEWVTKRKGWENLSAVRNGKVYVFDDSLLNRPGPRLTIGAKELAKVVHPECF